MTQENRPAAAIGTQKICNGHRRLAVVFEVLHQVADLGLDKAFPVIVLEKHTSGGGQFTDDRLQQRALSTPIRSDQSDNFATMQGQADVMENGLAIAHHR